MDKYYVYRPLLELIGRTEGTAKADGYNETLAYGRYTGGDVNLVSMTLDQIDALQTKMLNHPDNKWNSSAIGMYQIVRTTMRMIRKTLKLTGKELFDAGMQDRMCCFLLGRRGIDRYLAGTMTENALIDSLANEWASLPKHTGKGAYERQSAAVSVQYVRDVLAEVRARHKVGPAPPKEEEGVPPKVALIGGAVILAAVAVLAIVAAIMQ